MEARALHQGAKYTHSAQELERLGRLPGEGEAEQSQGGRLAERGDEQPGVWYKMAAASPPPSSPPLGIWGPPGWKQTEGNSGTCNCHITKCWKDLSHGFSGGSPSYQSGTKLGDHSRRRQVTARPGCGLCVL